jgi:hypothetical protein
MASVFFSNAQRIIAQVFEWLQSSLQTRIANLITDSFTSGIDKGTISGEGFLVVPGTNNTSASPTVNVTLGGIAYDPLGNRIFISSSDTTLYNEANITATTNDGLGNQILTPQSSGVINIPVTQNSTNYIWIDYLVTTNTSVFTLNEITNAKIFYELTDGYNIQVTTTNVPPDANSIYLASVTTTGTAVISGNISQIGRTYYTILAGLVPTTVSEGTQYQLAYYATSGGVITGNPNVMAADEVVVTDATGVPTTTGNGGTTTTEIGYIHGVTSPIQAQINTKVSKFGDSMSGVLDMGGNKITGLANGIAATDAAAFGQIPTYVPATSYAPAIVGMGSISTNTGFYQQLGTLVFIWGSFQAGTRAGVPFSISIPSQYTIDFTNLPGSSRGSVGFIRGITTTPDLIRNLFTDGVTAGTVFASDIGITGSGTGFSELNGNQIGADTSWVTYNFTIPIVV